MSPLPGIRGVATRLESWTVATRLRLLHRGVTVGPGCRFYGSPVVSRSGPSDSIRLGERVVLISRSRQTALGVNHPVVLRTMHPGATISIGDDTGISGGSICAATVVSIGSGCLIGANVTITDTDFHPVDDVGRRYLPLPSPRPQDAVRIGDDVFIGTGAVVLPGSTIGDHAVIGANAVVKGVVQPGEIVAGNPARAVRHLRSDDDAP